MKRLLYYRDIQQQVHTARRRERRERRMREAGLRVGPEEDPGLEVLAFVHPSRYRVVQDPVDEGCVFVSVWSSLGL